MANALAASVRSGPTELAEASPCGFLTSSIVFVAMSHLRSFPKSQILCLHHLSSSELSEDYIRQPGASVRKKAATERCRGCIQIAICGSTELAEVKSQIKNHLSVPPAPFLPPPCLAPHPSPSFRPTHACSATRPTRWSGGRESQPRGQSSAASLCPADLLGQ